MNAESDNIPKYTWVRITVPSQPPESSIIRYIELLFFQLRHDKNSIFQFCSPNEETAHVENESLDHQSKIRRELPRTFFCSIRVGFAHLYVRTPCACILSIAAEEVRSEAGKDQYDDLDVEMTCKYGPILCPNNISPSWKTIPISMIWAPWWWKTG